jgi:NTE family protein
MDQDRQPGTPELAPMKALVLGGGGPVGASWISAVLHELEFAGLSLATSDVVLGTSAGAVVGAWLTMRPEGLPALPELMRKRAAWHADNAATGGGDKDLLRRMAERTPGDTDATLSIAQAAIAATPSIPADQAEALWRPALPDGPWPHRLRIAAVNATTGAAHAWSTDDDISLAVAISCSTAAPGAAPPVEVAGAAWVDGGVRSNTNADLIIEAGGDNDDEPAARGRGKVLMVAPVPGGDLAREESILAGRGYDVRILIAEPYYQKRTDLLDPHFIDIATTAGTRQAREIAADLAKWCNE